MISTASPDPGGSFLAQCARASGPNLRSHPPLGGSLRQIRAEELDLRVVVILNRRGRCRSIRYATGLSLVGFVPHGLDLQDVKLFGAPATQSVGRIKHREDAPHDAVEVGDIRHIQHVDHGVTHRCDKTRRRLEDFSPPPLGE